MRKLASIQAIKEIHPIEGRDRIELAIVQGWSVIVQKNEYKVGDLTIFIEPDSQLPEVEEFEFLRKKKFRIKTMKMAGVISQGICFPLSILPKGRYEEGDNVTETLNITKYEPYKNIDSLAQGTKKDYPWLYKQLIKYKRLRPLAKKLFPSIKGFRYGFPTFISKTDETRIQNLPFVLLNKEEKYIGREKVDGQSGTFFLKQEKGFFGKEKYDYGVCSRNLRLFNKDLSYSQWEVSEKYKIEEALTFLFKNLNEKGINWVAIQGECISPSVQGNKYRVNEADFYAFNLLTNNGIIDCKEGEDILGSLGIKWCPLIAEDYVMPDTVQEVLSFADGKSKLNPETAREGIVFRSYKNRQKQSFKAVSPEFLLKNDE